MAYKSIEIVEGQTALFEMDGECTVRVEEGIAYVTPKTPMFIHHSTEDLGAPDTEGESSDR